MRECNDCDFRDLSPEEKGLCLLFKEFIENLNGSCPKEMTAEEIRQNCMYYLPAEENIERKPLCRASFYEHGRYQPCWIESFKDLFEDPYFTLKELHP